MKVGVKFYLKNTIFYEEENAQWSLYVSSNIQESLYYFDTGILYIKFKNQVVYEYRDVRKQDFQDLQKALSTGSWFHWNFKIKDRIPYKRIGRKTLLLS